MEIGSFIEMQFPRGNEYYTGDHIARLNSGRAGIYHAARCLGCHTVYLPYYQCETVGNFLKKKNINIIYYYINPDFSPKIDSIEPESCMVIVNYYGIFGNDRIKEIASRFKKVIIDNSQAFFSKPIEGAMNIYSARKFMGVPDGAYVIGNNADKYSDEYNSDYSSDTSDFLLKRIEYGCEGKTYESRMKNEKRIDESDIKLMSKLTHTILDGTDYSLIKNKRRENYSTASMLFNDINLINPNMYYDDTCVPMVYPLVVERDDLLQKLLDAKHFQGHWWSYLLGELDQSKFEYWLSENIIPITIDQRYGEEEIKFLYGLVCKEINK